MNSDWVIILGLFFTKTFNLFFFFLSPRERYQVTFEKNEARAFLPVL